MELKHFSHIEHPLILNEEKNVEDEIDGDYFCRICNLPILLSSFYGCTNIDCMYLLHEPCAGLPETMTHPWFPSSRFRLLEKPSNDDSHCKRCRKSCENFTYIDTSDPEICFHPICGVPMLPIKSNHKSHPSHPLVAVPEKTSAVCDACAEEQNGYFFMCHQCNFRIHVECALLPRIIKCTKHDHFLILTYSSCHRYQSEHFGPRCYSCLICSQKMFGSGAYSCAYCYGFVHLSCAIKDIEDVGTATDLQLVACLPAADQRWMIPHYMRVNFDGNWVLDDKLHDHPLNFDGNWMLDDKLHDHPLILYNDTENNGSSSSNNDELYLSDSQELTCCNACIEPIYPPFYACFQSHESGSRCHFHLHQLCSGVRSSVRTDLVIKDLQLRTWSKESLCSLFYCPICDRLGNGFAYYASDDNDEPRIYIHITCFIIPRVIEHASHEQHFLHLVPSQRNIIKNCCSDPKTGIGLYRCFDCHFIIDKRCAFLPGKIKHKYDAHPLYLITTGIANSDDNYFICEFCEEHIDTKFWYYGCEKCDNLFHAKCISSVGYLSKVKFGNSINVSCHPLHPVTFVRMLGFGSQSCGYCKEIVKGFVDEMAFCCSKCDFWMHFECAEKCSGAKKVDYEPPTDFSMVGLTELGHVFSINALRRSVVEVGRGYRRPLQFLR